MVLPKTFERLKLNEPNVQPNQTYRNKKINSKKGVGENKSEIYFREELVNKPTNIWILEKMIVKYQSLAKLMDRKAETP